MNAADVIDRVAAIRSTSKVADHRAAMLRRTFIESALFQDVLRAVVADPTRTDAHVLAAEALKVLE